MSKEQVTQIAQSLEGKRSRLKTCDAEPTGTKEKKLPKEVRAALEEHFKVKLTKVRVHTGGDIKEIATKLKAKAFTINQNIYFKKTSDAKDPEKLAREITHVIQKSGGKMKKVTKPGKALISK